MRILCLVDWPVHNRWIWRFLPDNQDQVDFVTISTPPDRFPGYGKLLGYYPRYIGLGLKARLRIRHYDLIVTWEGKNGVPLAFLRRLLGPRHPPMVILNFVLKGRVVLDFLWLIRFAMHSVDHITVVSQREIEHYSRELRLPRERFSQLLTVWPDHYGTAAPEPPPSGYILAAGRSHRDYGTLLEAVRGLPVHVVVNARSFNVRGLQPPPNVTLNPFLPPADFHDLVRRADFAVLPLFTAKHASGETFLLEAMSAHKAVIATETFSTVEFIDPGKNGLLVPPGDASALRQSIELLMSHPEQAREMGVAARRFYEENCSMPVFARRAQERFQQIVHASLNTQRP
ncbi:MAG: glycosyltransferase family 4 protein [Anaerolineae bacterium]|nr:glycosyltransferase family 4 protein [Anaerolineae bacterium]